MTDQSEFNDVTPADNALFENETPADSSESGESWQVGDGQPQTQQAGDAETSSLSADDANADADLPRPSRQEKLRARQRLRFSTAIPALVLIVGGVLALLRPYLRYSILAIGWVAGAVVLGLLARFLFQGRRERGLFFMTTLLILVVAFGALVFTGNVDLPLEWPLILTLPGLAMLLTFLFERSHDRQLILPALMLIVAGGTLLLFTVGFLDTSVFPDIALYWPLLLLLAALAVLPHAIRDRAE